MPPFRARAGQVVKESGVPISAADHKRLSFTTAPDELVVLHNLSYGVVRKRCATE
jgi:hypothetical protein